MQRGMALVVVGGMAYATFMTLYIVPIMYDILYRKVPKEVDLGNENIDDDPGDAAAYLQERAERLAREAAEAPEVSITPATSEVPGATGTPGALPPTA